ncbi:MAG: hypothetical protein EOO03_03000 [Chitinophagaceae bacterium]|nr:MAG: hypothetical protein EOO03_03000 [Chitinophagaceae bacterium]
MKFTIVFMLLVLALTSCRSRQDAAITIDENAPATQSFFPVTNYIYGQIEEIKQAGINPIKIDSTQKNTDSTWLKVEELSSAFDAFLTPVIDSINLTKFFTESSFDDKTIGAYTFTYTPLPNLPDSISLQRWDVYVNPVTNTVKRIFMVKKDTDNRELQLTWQSDQWCKIVTITANKDGQESVSSVQTIKWNFD